MIITTGRNESSVGVSILDCDHREMDEAYNELHSEIANGWGHGQVGYRLRGLVNFSLLHFALEEGMMEVTKYPMINRHRANHRHLIQQMNRLVSRYDHDGLIPDRQLMISLHVLSHEHIEADDKYYGNWLNRA